VLSDTPQQSYLALDLASGETLLSHNITTPRHIASLSKLMTALLILEHHMMDEEVSIPLEATQTEGAQIDLYDQEVLTVETLLESLLVSSANDSAIALAIHHSGSHEAFAQAMNKKAGELGLSSAYFYNATGLDVIEEFDDGRPFEVYGNQMSVSDLATLAQILWKYDFVKENVSKSTFKGTSADGRFYHSKNNTNQLLGSFLNVKGLKTGFTYLAGECLISIGETPDGHEVMTVLVGSLDRFAETKKILAWVYDVYRW
jgi:D-alanyl-D-alanine carboxypeptidase (penicillin-binding protein 5/6)